VLRPGRREYLIAYCGRAACGENSSSLARTCCSLWLRLVVSVTSLPGDVPAILLRNVFGSVIASPFRAVITSPLRSPARSAALPGRTWYTTTPGPSLIPNSEACSDGILSTVTPSWPRLTLRDLINCSATARAMFEGIENPKPMLPPDGESICELIPMSSAFVLTSAPPELPRLIGASVCRKSSNAPLLKPV
jgi:hypothetical protein